MDRLDVVLDTNVLVAGLRSRRGVAFTVLSFVGTGRFEIHLSVPLVLEYEEVLLRQVAQGVIERSVVDDVLDYHCSVGRLEEIFFLWRPYLKDPSDDMVLELAVRSACRYIITYNVRDFVGTDQFGIGALTPMQFLEQMGGIS